MDHIPTNYGFLNYLSSQNCSFFLEKLSEYENSKEKKTAFYGLVPQNWAHRIRTSGPSLKLYSESPQGYCDKPVLQSIFWLWMVFLHVIPYKIPKTWATSLLFASTTNDVESQIPSTESQTQDAKELEIYLVQSICLIYRGYWLKSGLKLE